MNKYAIEKIVRCNGVSAQDMGVNCVSAGEFTNSGGAGGDLTPRPARPPITESRFFVRRSRVGQCCPTFNIFRNNDLS